LTPGAQRQAGQALIADKKILRRALPGADDHRRNVDESPRGARDAAPLAAAKPRRQADFRRVAGAAWRVLPKRHIRAREGGVRETVLPDRFAPGTGGRCQDRFGDT